MGREIRRVPPNWQHPQTERMGHMRYQPMYESNYAEKKKEWLDGLAAWENKTHEDYASYRGEYWEWSGNPPERDYYIPYSKEDATWYQAYETVSEGTPTSPPFETQDELITYLVTNGDFWDKERGNGGWSLEIATDFVKGDGFRMSFAVSNGVIKEARDLQYEK